MKNDYSSRYFGDKNIHTVIDLHCLASKTISSAEMRVKMKKFVRTRKKKSSVGDKVFTIVNTMILTIFVIITLYPILNTLAISFNDGTDALRGGIYLWPRVFTWKNYQTIIHKQNLLTATEISILRTVIATVTQLFVTALLAYVLSRKNFIFRKQISLLYVLTMYVNGGLIPTFLLYKGLGLTNSFWVYIIPGMVSAGHFTIFLRIIVPLCKPVFATIALFIAVYQWNSWFDTMLYNRMRGEYTTLQYELMKLLSAVTNNSSNAETMKNAGNQVTPASIRAAATIITSLPIVCLYPFLQRYFVTGLTIGGVKE